MVVEFHPYQLHRLGQLQCAADVCATGGRVSGGMVVCQDDGMCPHEQSAAQEQRNVERGGVKFSGTDQAKANGLLLMVEVDGSRLFLHVEQFVVPGCIQQPCGILCVSDLDGVGSELVPDAQLGAGPASITGCDWHSLWHGDKSYGVKNSAPEITSRLGCIPTVHHRKRLISLFCL